MKTVAFFNNKSGVGKTTLVYHLAWMFADRGIRTLAVDLDPQSNLTAMFLNETRLLELWPDELHKETILGAIQPVLSGVGDVLPEPHVEKISNDLHIVPGDLGLSRFEDTLSDAWSRCHSRDEAAFRVMTAFHRIIENASGISQADIVLIDVGPNLGAINRSALIASEKVVIPLVPDLFSIQGLKNLGPTFSDWRIIWKELRAKAPPTLSIPPGEIQAIGYIIMQTGLIKNTPVKARQRWMNRIPQVYRESVLDAGEGKNSLLFNENDELAVIRHYRSLMSMAMDARKPMFFLKSADGAIGAHSYAVTACYEDFLMLAKQISRRTGLNI